MLTLHTRARTTGSALGTLPLCYSRILMSQLAAPLHEALPGTYADRPSVVKAIQGFAKSTGHRIVQAARCPKGITFRCKGYKTPGAETFECKFKVCVFRKTVDGITSSSWTLNHRSQTYRRRLHRREWRSQEGTPDPD